MNICHKINGSEWSRKRGGEGALFMQFDNSQYWPPRQKSLDKTGQTRNHIIIISYGWTEERQRWLSSLMARLARLMNLHDYQVCIPISKLGPLTPIRGGVPNSKLTSYNGKGCLHRHFITFLTQCNSTIYSSAILLNSFFSPYDRLWRTRWYLYYPSYPCLTRTC